MTPVTCCNHRRFLDSSRPYHTSRPPHPSACRLSAAAYDSPTPLIDALVQRGSQAHELPFHVPGHKRGQGVSERFRNTVGRNPLLYDLTEISGLDCLSSASGVLAEAQQLAAQAFGADRSWFLVNGCTAGIHAAVMACAGPGDTLLAARNCHLSVVSAMVLSGCRPFWVDPDIDHDYGVAHGVSPSSLHQALKAALAEGHRIRGVMLVSPTYFGAVAPIKELADVCHSYGVPLIVDEAHGAHFGTAPGLPPSALSQGADCTIHSTHKVLSAMTQAAMLHIRGQRMSADRISRALQTLQSSSPSYILMASLDAARAMISHPDFLAEPMQAAQYARHGLQRVPGVHLLGPQHTSTPTSVDSGSQAQCSGVAGFDPLRITLGVWDLGSSGFDVAALLEQRYGVVVELATSKVVVCAMGPGSRMVDAEGLVAAFQDLTRQRGLQAVEQRDAAGPCGEAPRSSDGEGRQGRGGVGSSGAAPEASSSRRESRPTAVLTPREAFYAASTRVSREEAVGRVSVELLCPYPPGVPVVVPGEVITARAIEILLQAKALGGTVTGASDNALETFEVVDDAAC